MLCKHLACFASVFQAIFLFRYFMIPFSCIMHSTRYIPFSFNYSHTMTFAPFHYITCRSTCFLIIPRVFSYDTLLIVSCLYSCSVP